MGDKIDWAQVDLPLYCAQQIKRLFIKVSHFIILRKSSIKNTEINPSLSLVTSVSRDIHLPIDGKSCQLQISYNNVPLELWQFDIKKNLKIEKYDSAEKKKEVYSIFAKKLIVLVRSIYSMMITLPTTQFLKKLDQVDLISYQFKNEENTTINSVRRSTGSENFDTSIFSELFQFDNVPSDWGEIGISVHFCKNNFPVTRPTLPITIIESYRAPENSSSPLVSTSIPNTKDPLRSSRDSLPLKSHSYNQHSNLMHLMQNSTIVEYSPKSNLFDSLKNSATPQNPKDVFLGDELDHSQLNFMNSSFLSSGNLSGRSSSLQLSVSPFKNDSPLLNFDPKQTHSLLNFQSITSADPRTFFLYSDDLDDSTKLEDEIIEFADSDSDDGIDEAVELCKKSSLAQSTLERSFVVNETAEMYLSKLEQLGLQMGAF